MWISGHYDDPDHYIKLYKELINQLDHSCELVFEIWLNSDALECSSHQRLINLTFSLTISLNFSFGYITLLFSSYYVSELRPQGHVITRNPASVVITKKGKQIIHLVDLLSFYLVIRSVILSFRQNPGRHCDKTSTLSSFTSVI